MKSPLAGLSKFDFIGVLLLRIGVGALLAFHGYPILTGGGTVWADVGEGAAIASLPANFFEYAGLASGIVQFLGGILLIIGMFTRGTALLLTVIVGFALANHIAASSFQLSFLAHLQMTLALLGLVFIGPGRLSLDRKGI
ncbi:DoxX family protein [Pelagicoccus sp. SDUM812005]|uniref:DoxX family protein n=1 Tax=Pelagicoccus sp. SDUM812005 TaxID=3041257 RepID=UPI00280C44B5|nr:DoxX family protein [Pelagicoccus sp. SDUM812005]MDQ8179660.1 DoxX family protein [Pelagicoccus sp. SDUM812005]